MRTLIAITPIALCNTVQKRTWKLIPLLAAVLLVSGCSPPATSWSEADYDRVSDEIRAITEAWRGTRPGMDEADKPYSVYLVLDTNVPALWIARDGDVQPTEKVMLPAAMDWSIEYASPGLRKPIPSPVVLKQRGDKSKINAASEVVYVEGWFPGTDTGINFFITNSGGGFGFHKPDQVDFNLRKPKLDAGRIDVSFIVAGQELNESKIQ